MDETLLYQIRDDLQDLFNSNPDYDDLVVKTAYDGDTDISYPCVIVSETSNSDVNQYMDDQGEHIVQVGYQIMIMADQTETLSAEENTRTIMNIIKNYMRGERYHALRRSGTQNLYRLSGDNNIKIGYMRYTGCIDIDTNTIYRRN